MLVVYYVSVTQFICVWLNRYQMSTNCSILHDDDDDDDNIVNAEYITYVKSEWLWFCCERDTQAHAHIKEKVKRGREREKLPMTMTTATTTEMRKITFKRKSSKWLRNWVEQNGKFAPQLDLLVFYMVGWMAGPLAFGMQITAYQLDVCVAI